MSTILFPLVFGIINYGLWFNDSLNLRQGVREGARLAAVENFAVPASSSCSALTGTAELACRTKELIAPTTGTAYVKVVVPTSGWAKGNSVLVCGMTKETGVTGVLPMPNGGYLRSKVQMSIEVDDTVLTTDGLTGTPAGADWSWCT